MEPSPSPLIAPTSHQDCPLSGTENRLSLFLPYCFFFCLGIWLLKLPLCESLWLDETVSWWVQSESWPKTWQYANSFQRPPLYFLVLKAWISLFGFSEIAMRSLSLGCTAISLSILWLIAKRWFGRDTAWISCLLFLFSDEMLTLSMGARPYAMAIMFALAMVGSLLCWLSTRSTRWLVFSSIYATATWYTHFFYIGLVVLALPFFVMQLRRITKKQWHSLLMAVLVTCVACIPGVITFVKLSNQVANLSFVSTPTPVGLAFGLLPKPFLALICCLILLACIGGLGLGLRIVVDNPSTKTAIKASILTAVVPVLVFGLASTLGSHSLFVSRYFAWNQFGLFLLIAAVCASLAPGNAKKYPILGLVFFVIVRCSTRSIAIEDWRGVLQGSPNEKNVPILLFSGLIESKIPSWRINDPARRYLQAPAAYYGLGSESSHAESIISIPPDPSDLDQVASIDADIRTTLDKSNTVHIIAYKMRTTTRGAVSDQLAIEKWIDYLDTIGFQRSLSEINRKDWVAGVTLYRHPAAQAVNHDK
jgi:hypothetical protein